MISASSRCALLIANPNARNGNSFTAEMRSVLEEKRIALIEKTPDRNNTISDIIRQNSDVNFVIVAGGDGSLNAAAHGILDTGLPLAVIPMGTANDFARTVGIPDDPLEAVRQIPTYEAHPIDLGEVNGHPFFNVASIGLSAKIAQELSAEAKKKYGKLGYAIVSARILLRSQLFSAYLEYGDKTEKISTLQISIGNGKFYGGGMAIKENASIDDGKLDIYSLEVDHWWKLLRLLPSLRQGTHGKWGDVRAFSTTDLVIRTKKPRAVNTDGELVCETPAHFRILRNAIQVLRPNPISLG